MGFGHHGLGGCGCCDNPCSEIAFPDYLTPIDSFNGSANTSPWVPAALVCETEFKTPTRSGIYPGSTGPDATRWARCGVYLSVPGQQVFAEIRWHHYLENYRMHVHTESNQGFFDTGFVIPNNAVLKTQIVYDSGDWIKKYYSNDILVASYIANETPPSPYDPCGFSAQHHWKAWATALGAPIPPGVCEDIVLRFQEE